MIDAAEEHSSLDGVQLAVMTSRFENIARGMINTVVRTARSRVVNTSRDCSCVILTGDSKLLVTAESIPIHVTGGPDLMAKAMKRFHRKLRQGDAFLHNSPYHGNSHAADHSILVPVVDDAGTHHFTVLAKAHQADCGNSLPTTYMGAARDVYEEGALMFPCVKIQDNYRDCDDIIRMSMLRIRVPDQWWGDYLALLGAARIGERRILEFADEIGWETLHAYTRSWFTHSEDRMIQAIRAIPAGSVTATSIHDPMPNVPDGIPISVTIETNHEKALIEVDLTDNLDCQPCGLNLSEATARSSAMIGVLNSIDHTVPVNAGSLSRIRIHLRENCVVGIPRHPASCSVATTNVADRVTSLVQRAMAELGDGVGLAEGGPTLSPAVGVISGHDPRADNAPFVNELMLPSGTGGPGGPETDGWLPFLTPGNAGMALRDSVEIDELSFPIRIHEQRIVPDSEGAGRHRGAPAAYLEFGPVNTTLEVMSVIDGAVSPARGARGGMNGACATQRKRHVLSDQYVELNPFLHVVLSPEETLVSTCCSGGGYGHPDERDPALVSRDVAEGYITADRAANLYGVALTETGDVDDQATVKLRVKIRKNRENAHREKSRSTVEGRNE
jgi:N-methylhydantoinase B